VAAADRLLKLAGKKAGGRAGDTARKVLIRKA
jgi:hypothetical protein